MTGLERLASPRPVTQAKHHPRSESTSVAKSAQTKRPVREFIPVKLLCVLRALTGDGRGLIVFRESNAGGEGS